MGGGGAQSAVGWMLREAVIEDARAQSTATEASSSSTAIVVRPAQAQAQAQAQAGPAAPLGGSAGARSPIRARAPRVLPGDVGAGGSVASFVLSPPRVSSMPGGAGNVDLCLNVSAY